MEKYDQQDFDAAQKLVKGRQFFTRKPKKPADIIAQLMARTGYGQLKSADELENTWNQIADEKWRSQTRVTVIKRGVLEVVVGNSVLIQRLEFEKKRLLADFKTNQPKINLKDIRFRIGNV